jgi:hypothetical protein
VAEILVESRPLLAQRQGEALVEVIVRRDAVGDDLCLR